MARIPIIILAKASLVAWMMSGCARGRNDEQGTAAPMDKTVRIEKLTGNGGRLSWYKGDKHDLIAYDAVTNPKTKATEVFTMEPDGSEQKCVTCKAAIPKGFVGQPEWHPDGEHIVIQVENESSQHSRFDHPSWGFNNDLWIVKRDGTGAELIYKTPPNHAALHPHLNDDGTRIMFSERIPTGESRFFLKKRTPGGENPWDGWQIHIADFDIRKKGTAILSNHRELFQDKGGFYETHGFTKDGKILFSHTVGGKAYVDDSYLADSDGTGVRKLIDSPGTWEEHGVYSPSGRSLVFNSSRGDPSWRAGKSDAATLSLDLYLKPSTGEIRRLTDMSSLGESDRRYLTSDFDWDRTGTRIAFLVAQVDRKASWKTYPSQIWLLTFPEPQ